jgi:hypothetical protein
MNARPIVLIILATLTVHRLAAQTYQVSVNAQVIPSSTGFEVRYGTNRAIWNCDACLSTQFVKTIVEHLMEPDETERYTEVTPYCELSFHRIIGVGFAPMTVRRTAPEWRPEATLTLAAPINVWGTVNVFPRVQLRLPMQEGAFPLIYLGLGVSYAL